MTLISGANPALIPSEPSQSSLSRPVGFDPGEREPCSLGVGCEEAGVCYATAHGEPDRCPVKDVYRALEEAIDLLDDSEIAHPLRWENALAKARNIATKSTGEAAS